MVFSTTQAPVVNFKQYLTPQGEYLPWLTEQVLELTGNTAALNNPHLGNYIRGPRVAIENSDISAVLFCFEAINPIAIRTLLKQYPEKPPFIAHPIAHGWFHSNVLYQHQLDTMLRIQAVWNQVTIISAGNMTTGKVYLPNGRLYSPPHVAKGDRWSIQIVE